MADFRKLGFVLLPLLWFLGCADSVEVSEDIRSAADEYLTLMDQGNYPGAWESSASIFKEVVSRDAWNSQMEGVRKKFGKAKTRTRTNAIVQKDPSNHPPGEYIMLNFDSGFEKDDAIETLVLFKEDNQWRLAGYFTK